MINLSLSLRIENLLVRIAPSYYGRRDDIENKPYETIMEALQCRLPKIANEFECEHSNMGNRSLSQLINDGYDIESLIKNLKIIINKGV